MSIKTKYQCPVCGRVYDAKSEAAECYQPPQRAGLHEGDIVQSENHWHVFVIKRIPHDGGIKGASMRPWEPFYLAHGIPNRPVPGYYVGSFWCHARLYAPDKADLALVRKLKARLKAAEKVAALLTEAQAVTE